MKDICPECGRLRKKLKRSDAQRALQFMWTSIIAKEIGYTKDELHEILKHEWAGYYQKPKVIKYNGKEIQPQFSTEYLTIVQNMDWLNKLEELAGKLNIILPYPDDKWEIAMGRKTHDNC